MDPTECSWEELAPNIEQTIMTNTQQTQLEASHNLITEGSSPQSNRVRTPNWKRTRPCFVANYRKFSDSDSSPPPPRKIQTCDQSSISSRNETGRPPKFIRAILVQQLEQTICARRLSTDRWTNSQSHAISAHSVRQYTSNAPRISNYVVSVLTCVVPAKTLLYSPTLHWTRYKPPTNKEKKPSFQMDAVVEPNEVVQLVFAGAPPWWTK